MRSMTVDNDGNSLIVLFLDQSIGDEIRIMEIGDELMKMASEMPTDQSLVLDFQNVEYVSSAMVGQIVQLRNATNRDGVELTLRHVSETIKVILRTMHLDKVFRIETSDE